MATGVNSEAPAGAARHPVRLGVIGAGRMGLTHLRAIAATPAAALAAVIDPVPAARAAALTAGAPVYAGLEEALSAQPLDAVIVAAPTPRHAAIVAACARHGLHVLCEKPCGTSPADVRAAEAAAAGAGVVLQIGYWRRYVPALVALRARIADGELGDVALVQCWQWDEAPPSAGFRSASGGIAIDMGVHELDQIRWLTGQELSEIQVAVAGVGPSPPLAGDPDSLAALARLSGGGVAYLSLGRHLGEPDAVWVEVIGTRGRARVAVLEGPAGDDAFRAALSAQLEDFCARVRGRTAGSGAGAEDARAALELAVALTAAATVADRA